MSDDGLPPAVPCAWHGAHYVGEQCPGRPEAWPWSVAPPPRSPAPITLDQLVELAVELRGPRQPQRIRVARDLYDALRREASALVRYPTAGVASSVYGIPLEIDDELPPGEHRVDTSRWSS